MDKLKTNLLAKSVPEQIYLGASLLAFTCVFLPWFSDSDRFTQGTTFLGLTGPTAFIGLSLMLLNGAAAFQVIYSLYKPGYVFGKIIADFLYKFTGFINLYLVGIAISVFSHPATATNLLAKHLLWGNYIALVSGLLLMAGLLINKKELQIKSVKEARHSYTVDLSNDETHTIERKHRTINEVDSLAEYDFNYGEIETEPDYQAIKHTPIAEITSNKTSGDTSLRKQWQSQQDLAQKIDQKEETNLF